MQHADVFVLLNRSRLLVDDELALGLLGEAAASAEDALLVQLGPDGLELLQLLDLSSLDLVLKLPILFGFSHLMEESLELLIVFEPDRLLGLRQILRGVFQIVNSCCPLILRNPPGRIEDSEELLGDRNLVLGQCLLSGTCLSEAITEPLEWTRNYVVSKLKEEEDEDQDEGKEESKSREAKGKPKSYSEVLITYSYYPVTIVFGTVPLLWQEPLLIVLSQELFHRVHRESFDRLQLEYLQVVIGEETMEKRRRSG